MRKKYYEDMMAKKKDTANSMAGLKRMNGYPGIGTKSVNPVIREAMSPVKRPLTPAKPLKKRSPVRRGGAKR